MLYTEMVTTGAIRHGSVERHLRFNAEEHSVALQLGGSEAADLAYAAKLGGLGRPTMATKPERKSLIGIFSH